MLARLALLASVLLVRVFAAVGTKRQDWYPYVYVQDSNLWVAYSDSDKKQLSTTGTPESPFDSGYIFLSPDKLHVAAWQYTPAQEHTITLIESSPADRLEPRYDTIYYPKPGDAVRIDRPRIFQLATRNEIPTNNTLFLNPYEIKNIGWSPTSSEYRFVYHARGHQRLRVLGMGVNGVIRTLVDERSDTFINYRNKYYCEVLQDTQELIWASERDGWNHLYLYDLINGTLKNQITKGNWLVRKVERIDTATRRIWVTAFGIIPNQDPYYAHLHRVNLEGTGGKTLTYGGNGTETLGDGDHTWAFTDNDTRLTDIWSRVDQPETEVVRDAETGTVLFVKRTPVPTNAASFVEMFSAPGRDGTTMIYGIIVKPANFDPAKKYPILEDIYAGPHEFGTPKSYSELDYFRGWAGTDYLLVKVDGMGTNWRSKAFHDASWKNLKDAGFPDRIAWMKAAAATRPWMDLSRVGIFGGSAGGQNAVAALLWHGDFYKAAAADSGNHDNRMDNLPWNEQWMGWPVQKAYEDSSNVVHAGRLQGKLYLSVPMLDRVVDPSATYQLVHALNQAGKDYEFVLLPMAKHSDGFGAYGRGRMEAFFRKHLLEG